MFVVEGRFIVCWFQSIRSSKRFVRGHQDAPWRTGKLQSWPKRPTFRWMPKDRRYRPENVEIMQSELFADWKSLNLQVTLQAPSPNRLKVQTCPSPTFGKWCISVQSLLVIDFKMIFCKMAGTCPECERRPHPAVKITKQLLNGSFLTQAIDLLRSKSSFSPIADGFSLIGLTKSLNSIFSVTFIKAISLECFGWSYCGCLMTFEILCAIPPVDWCVPTTTV